MKRPTEPRIAPVDDVAMSEDQRILAGVGASNVIRTLVRHENLLKPWLALAEQLLFTSRLSPRERELVVLRVALRTESEYEWANHALAAIAAGVAEDELRGLSSDAAVWSDSEAALLHAVDDLCSDNCVSDDTWTALAANRDDKQIIEILFLIGFYRMNAGVLNSLGVQTEPGRPRLGQLPDRPDDNWRPAAPTQSASTADAGVDGTWMVIFHHPAGDQQLTLEMRSGDGVISGSVTNPALGVSVPIVSGSVTGSRFSFAAPITTPVQVDVGYSGVVTGDAISGDVTVGGGGVFPFAGNRA